MRDRGIHYHTNGGGRDTYIFNNNGGFALPKTTIKYPNPGAMDPRLTAAMRQKDKFPHLHSKPINYNQDGTGRDTYIMIGNGGLQRGWAGKEYRNAFKDSLRSYTKN